MKLSLLVSLLFSACFIFGQEAPAAPSDAKEKKVVEQMPRFPGCEDLDTDDKGKEKCAKEKMLQYIYKTLRYPSPARQNGIEGMAVISYNIMEDGNLADITIERDPGYGCGDAAKAVVKSMNSMSEKWIPGMQGGKAVPVKYTLPIKFKLSSQDKSKAKKKRKRRN